MIDIISLGAGVQSSSMALLAAHGEIEPMPQLAIFADTGWEPRGVYNWLAWLETQLPFPVVRVGNCGIRRDQISARVRGKAEDGQRWASIPYFTQQPDGKIGKIRRQCTTEYKIEPITKYIRRAVLGLGKGQHAPKQPVIRQWRGISTDEASRMKPSREKWIEVRYPLAMELGLSRAGCLAWMQKNGYPQPPRSACLGCPFHSDYEWSEIKKREDEWRDVVEFDRAIRDAGGMRGKTYLHRSCQPLDEIDFTNAAQAELFDEECEGMCGL